ncbi:MAG: class I SAM-dependent methyltransferase [Chloroflexi bacterium]|nr:class I SAM-dependent methyltransferase [Chloroflexota bacterium]
MDIVGRIDYDHIAGTYARCRRASERVIAHVTEMLSGRKIGRVLEIGCGTANHLVAISATLGAHGVGLDRSLAMLRIARGGYPGLHFCLADAEAVYPFPANTFDLALCVNVIHYITRLETFYREAQRVLRPDGIIVTVTDSKEDIRRRTLSHYFPETIPIELRRYPPISAIQRAMEAAGFREIQVSHTEHAFPLGPSHVRRYRQKAYSALRLIPEEAFRRGLARLEREVTGRSAQGQELYTYIWGTAPAVCKTKRGSP